MSYDRTLSADGRWSRSIAGAVTSACAEDNAPDRVITLRSVHLVSESVKNRHRTIGLVTGVTTGASDLMSVMGLMLQTHSNHLVRCDHDVY